MHDSDTAVDAISATAIFDVRDYGALGDGITDDTAAIQAAINAAHAAGGGTVVMSAGTYRVSGTADKSDGAIQLLSNVTLHGAGMGQTIVKVIDNNPYDITGVIRTPYDEVTHDVGVFGLTIDGNRENNTVKIDGFYTGVAPGDPRQDYNVTVDSVEIMNMSGYGFDPHEQTLNLSISNSVAHHNGLDGFVADGLVDSVFSNNIAYANDRHGFNVTTSTVGLLMLDNMAYENGSAGVMIQRGSEDLAVPSDIVIQGGSFHDNGREGINIRFAQDITILDTQIYGNERQGIRIDGVTNALIEGATIFNNSQAGTGLYDEIRLIRFDDTLGPTGLIYDTTGVVIKDSTIYSDAAIKSRYGIYEAPEVEGVNQSIGNTIIGMATGATYMAPQLITAAVDQAATARAAFSYQVAPSSFVDGDQGTFTLSAKLGSGEPLPSWLTFNPATGEFTGTPPSDGTFAIVVEARDSQGLKDATTFNLVVASSGPIPVINGTAGNDNLVGTAAGEDLNGLTGDDVLMGAGGADMINGGEGADTASYASSAAGVAVSLVAGTAAGGDAAADTLISIENLTGSAFADQLSGDAGPNVLSGGDGADILRGFAGADTLDGGSGTDQLEGGDGDDLYIVNDAGDTVIEADNLGMGGTDTVRATVSHTLAANVENLTLIGTGNINGTGNGKANVLLGNAGNNVLDGGTGSDTMEGGAGDDSYYVNVTTDVVIEAEGGGTDTIFSTVTRTLQANVENLTLIGTAAVNGTGNSLANVISGNSGDNTLSGAEGNDTLNGGLGNDILRGGLGADTFVFAVGDQSDTVADFDAAQGDIIDLSDFTSIDSFAELKSLATQTSTGVFFELGGGDRLTLTGATLSSITAAQVQLANTGKFNANLPPEPVWRHDDGTVVIWRPNGIPGGYDGQTIAGISNALQLQHTADFNNDGNIDLVWRDSSGAVQIWHSTEVLGGFEAENILGMGLEWQIKETGDFNGDGKDDLLWRHDNGNVLLWNSTDQERAWTGQAINGFGSVWKIQQVADFNGDGKDDMLWRHDNGSVILFNSTGEPGGYAQQNVNGIGNEWQVEQAADFNGDGKGDILWRHDDGTVIIWNSNGIPGGYDAQNIVGIGNEWQIQKVSDVTGDGKADLFWRHDDGTVIAWNSTDVPGGYTGQDIVGIGNEWHLM